MPDVRGLARRIHAYMSSPDCEGGDGPATALGKIEAAIRREYAKVEVEVERLRTENQAFRDGQKPLYGDARSRILRCLRVTNVDEGIAKIERLQNDAKLVAFLSRPDVVVGLSEGAVVLVRIRESECEGCGDNVISAARMAMFMEQQKQAAEAEEG